MSIYEKLKELAEQVVLAGEANEEIPSDILKNAKEILAEIEKSSHSNQN